MTGLTISLKRRSEMFTANAAAMRALVEDLRDKVAAIREDGAALSRSPMTSAGGPGRSSSAFAALLALGAIYQEAAVGAFAAEELGLVR